MIVANHMLHWLELDRVYVSISQFKCRRFDLNVFVVIFSFLFAFNGGFRYMEKFCTPEISGVQTTELSQQKVSNFPKFSRKLSLEILERQLPGKKFPQQQGRIGQTFMQCTRTCKLNKTMYKQTCCTFENQLNYMAKFHLYTGIHQC